MTLNDPRPDPQGQSEPRDSRPADAAASASMTVERLPFRYRLTAADRQAVRRGEKLFILGSAVAKAQLLTYLMHNVEIAWYWVAPETRVELITDVLLPVEQEVSYGSVKIPPAAVSIANREARRLGLRIVGAGHSHHDMGAWTSRTDEDLMDQLSAEGVGFHSMIRTIAQGLLTRRQSSEPGPATLDAVFPDWPHVEATISGPPGLNPADLSVQLTFCRPRLFSLFSTSDTQGRYHFPQLAVTRCSLCGGRVEQEIIHPTAICVIGPVAIPTLERDRFLAVFEQRAPRRFVWSHGGSWSAGSPAADPAPAVAALTCAEPPNEFQEKTAPAPFSVYRRGELIGLVDAKILEEAAWKIPALGKALHWTDDVQESQAAAAEVSPASAPQAEVSTDPGPAEKGDES